MVKPTDTEIEELMESFANGNRNFVADEICGRSPSDAAYIAGSMVAYWLSHGNPRHPEHLIRAIGRRIED